MMLIDRKKVRRAFSEQAGWYDGAATIQKRVISRIVSQAHGATAGYPPESMLDLGSGTGMLLQALRGLWPAAFAVGLDLAPGMSRTARSRFCSQDRTHFVTGDAERLPFASGMFDLVLSTSTLQWLESLETVFSEVFRVLAPGGSFHFALFGERTLYELHESYRHAVAGESETFVTNRLQRFFTRADVAEALAGSGFSRIQVGHYLETEQHRDVQALLRSLRQIGAGNAAPGAPRGLSGRGVMLRMFEHYRKEFGVGGQIPATYDVIQGIGIKSDHTL